MAPGCALLMRAATPATCADAALVPAAQAHPPAVVLNTRSNTQQGRFIPAMVHASSPGCRMSPPGAAMSTYCAPVLVYPAGMPGSVYGSKAQPSVDVAATVMMGSAAPGRYRQQASMFSRSSPAGAIKSTPRSLAKRATTSSMSCISAAASPVTRTRGNMAPRPMCTMSASWRAAYTMASSIQEKAPLPVDSAAALMAISSAFGAIPTLPDRFSAAATMPAMWVPW